MKTIISYKQFINESKVKVYHGDNHNTKVLNPSLMNNGNNQEGIGIYFGSLETAEKYGKNVIEADIDTKNFIESREPIQKHLKNKIKDILIDLHKIDPEILYYDCTDWGIEVQEPEDVKYYHLEELAENLKDEEVRNFQVDLAQKFGVINFVKSWIKVFPRIYGTYHKQYDEEIWYAILSPKVKLTTI